MRTQLLCTFTKRNRLYDTIGLIIECHDIVFNKIYVFANEDDHHQLICTYNIPQNVDNFIEGIDTIALHRKKQTNTLYTINSLNEIIREKNNGILDKTFPVPWEEYQNQLLLVNDEGLNKIHTRIYTIVNVDTWENDQKLKNEL
jgi:hypothetical protein